MITRRIGTDDDGWPVLGDIIGRPLDEAIADEQRLMAYWLSDRHRVERVQIGVDPDGFPIVERY